MKTKLKGNIILLITAIIWGTTFVAQSEGMKYVQPFTYNAVRTLLGGIVLLPVIALFRRGESSENDGKSRKSTITGGIACGIFLFIAGSLQQCGIAMTTAGKAGFITALYVIIGAVCGDHCSPISDTTIMTSTGAQCDHVNHVSTQLPYAITVAAVSALGYLLSGFVQNVFAVLGCSILLMLAVLIALKVLTSKASDNA